MNTSTITFVTAGLILSSLVVGCGVDVDVPEPRTVPEISSVLLQQVRIAEEHHEAGTLTTGHLSALNMSVVWLRGHLANSDTGTDEQLQALDEIHRRLVSLRRNSGADPEANEPTDKLDPDTVDEILRKIRAVAETIPDTIPDTTGVE